MLKKNVTLRGITSDVAKLQFYVIAVFLKHWVV